MAQWTIDSANSEIRFAVRHFWLRKVRGHLHGITGTLDFDPAQPKTAKVSAAIDTATLHTGFWLRDRNLRSQQMLNVRRYPSAHFHSTRFEQRDTHSGRLHGELTLNGKTRPITLDVRYLGGADQGRAAFVAEARLKRGAFGLRWSWLYWPGNLVVGGRVRLWLDIRTARTPNAVSTQLSAAQLAEPVQT